mgnify:CR=1 FL=1
MSDSASQSLTPWGFFDGFKLPFRALRLIFRTPKLTGLSLLCAFVTAGALLGVVALAINAADWLTHRLVTGESTWLTVASVALQIVFTIVFFVVGAFTVPNLVLAPVQDPLADATEVALGDFTPEPFSLGPALRSTWESVKHTLLRLFFMLLGLVVLFPLHFVPVAGSVLWLVLSSIWSMWWLATENLSNAMSRHLISFGQVVRALRKRPALAMGFGATLHVILWVPILNCFLMPVATVAGTMLYRRLRTEGAVTPP